MADTDTETLQNGTATLTEEEEERLKQRPADIDADVREMERRKRVEALMSSKLFREELERVLDQQITEGGDAPLLQRIREMVGGRLHSGSLRGPSCVLPINDIRGIEGVGYEKGEKILRCKLAAVYRLVDLFGWTQTGLNGQITARLNTAVEQVLTTPRGLLPHEVTASSLVKVDMQGVIQDQGTTNFPINVEGFSLHAAVHAARPDIRCVLHVRSHAALCVSCVPRGLLPLCHEAAKLGEFTLHRAPLGILDNEEKDKLVRALGPHSKVLILANDGVLCCGATLEEAFYHARLFTAAAEVQLRLAAIPMDQLSVIDDVTRRQIFEASLQAPADATKWRLGGEEFEGLMRMLDNAGFRTGYIYRHPRIKNDVPKPKNDVEVPPAVSSLGYLLEEEELYRQGLWKKGTGKCGERTRWLNSPNVYQRVEVLETGTNDPKKITKWVDANTEEWVQDGSPAHSSTPVKIDTLQFVPKNTNPKEFKKLQQQIKENRRADKISAGPQSHILEGVTWDEANQLAEDAANTHTGDHVVLMGAASKGIIQRGYQHNATVYSAPYARNPFDRVTDTEIEAYHRAVTKGKDYDTDLSESEAISGAQITSPASAPSETEEESRDEHRVLRIETMQAPVASQPEVVLSDVDTTDFLNAERSHADRTKVPRDPVVSDDDVFYPPSVTRGVQSVITASVQQRALGRDPNLLSDDEVFLDSSVSTMTSGVISPMTSPQPVPAHVIVRSNTVAITRNVRGTNEANPLTEALSANKRSTHEYTRSASFENIVKFYESPSKTDENKIHPKCKTSLHSRLNEKAEPLTSSRSSLVSIPSLEWDGKARSDYALRTRSLPRLRVTEPFRLYRTRSHCGFINAYIKDPNPKHYHLPRCRSCGATSNSLSWELNKEELLKKSQTQYVYRSFDNIPQKCSEETERPIKVKQTVVPVFKVEKVPEFVDSQEFTEDNYLCDIGTSFSSENQTVIEKKDQEVDSLEITVTKDTNKGHENDNDVYRAECVQIDPVDDMNTSLDTTEGEYHSFTDDFEEAYESPVKDLVDKDIRDYSVPINLYCDDYSRKNEISPKKSPYKGIDVAKTVLEPILEESKSSYGDDSGSLSKLDFDIKSLAESAIADVLDAAVNAVAQKSDRCDEISMLMPDNKTKETSELETGTQQETILSTQKEKGFTPLKTETHICRIDNSIGSDTNHRKSSVEHSVASSTAELVTLDSTAEFEKIEFISELLLTILNRIEVAEKDMLYAIGQSNVKYESSKKGKIDHLRTYNINGDDLVAADTELALEEIYESPNPHYTCEIKIITNEPKLTESIKIPQNHNEDNDETFSITSLIDDMESKLNLNETALTENSDSGITEAFKISESVLYYIFNRVVFISNNKNKKITIKTVVTVVDPEDIMYTADTLWPIDKDSIDANEIDPADSHDKSYIVYSDNMYRSIEFDRCSNYNRVNRNDSEDFYEEIEELNDSALFNTLETENDYDVDDDCFAENNVLKDILNVENDDEHNAINFNLQPEYLNNNIVGLFREKSAVENAFDIDGEHFAENNVVDDILNVEHIDEHNEINVVALESADFNNNVVAQFRENNFVDQIDNAVDIDDVYFAGNNAVDVIINVDNVDETNARNFVPIESEDFINDIEEHFMENNVVDQNENDDSDNYSSDGEECKELSDNNGIEIAEEIAYISYASYEIERCEESLGNETSLDNDLNDTFIEHDVDEISNDSNLNATANATFSHIDLNDTTKLYQSNKEIERSSDETFIETLDEMNIAFVHTSSSPEKASTVFESCTESPIKNSNVSFLSQEIGGDTISSSPFINRTSIISMSLTENTGGIKYWVSFDDSVNDKYDFTNRVWRKIKQVDDTVPSFYGVNFEDKDNETYPKYRKMSVLVEDSPKTEPEFKNDENSNNNGVNKIETDRESVDKELLELSLPSSSSFYKTCDLQEDESPQKKLLYEVHKRRLYSTWPPYEDTLFYRIISKFRMSESFDPSELDNARINSL